MDAAPAPVPTTGATTLDYAAHVSGNSDTLLAVVLVAALVLVFVAGFVFVRTVASR